MTWPVSPRNRASAGARGVRSPAGTNESICAVTAPGSPLIETVTAPKRRSTNVGSSFQAAIVRSA